MAYDIPAAIEAGSLSSITPIASNPPPHPHGGRHVLKQSLTLYIARVPGSRDVFLTPLKPREKIVTAQDVQSSLYYIHFNTDADTEALQHQAAPSSVNSNATELITSTNENVQRRKPVPPPRSPLRRSPSPAKQLPRLPAMQTSYHQQNAPSRVKSQVARKPVLSDITNAAPSHISVLDLPEVPRRQLPSPPAEDEGYGSSLTVNDAYTKRHSPSKPQGEDRNDYFGTLPQAGSLTIIRRDPATCAQWNVATVRDPPKEDISSAALLSPTLNGKTRKGGAPLWLDITNPGYQQYINSNRSDSRISTSTSSTENDTTPEGIFRRRLYLPGSRFSDRRWIQKPSQNPTPQGASSRRDADTSPYPDLAPPLIDRRSAGYSFFSPWDGRCDFSTSTSGRALKCRHLLPNNQGSVEVSELRFNLPTTVKQASVSTSVAEKRGSYFHGLHRRLKSNDSWGGGPSPDGDQELPTYMVDEDGKLDLSLGQERAGGGFGGKQAKLGKLIVHPDGVAMLDLLVAANIGLWWRAWERV